MLRCFSKLFIKNFHAKVLSILLLFSLSESWGQTTIWGLYSGGSAPAAWTFSNNVATNAIDQTTYWLVDAGSPSDKITTSSYNLCAYSSATVCLQVATFGAGANNSAKIEVSYDGGATYTDIFNTTTPTSSTYNSLECYTLSQVSNQVVIRISNNGTAGRGVRIKNYSLAASGSGGCGGYTVTYNGNGNTGGSVPVDGASYASGASVTVLGNTGSLVKSGCFTFDGWATSAGGSLAYTAGQTFAIAANTNLYAHWVSTSFAVTFNNNGGSGSMTNQSNCVAANLNSNTFTNSCFTFAGWNTSANGSGTAYANNASYNFAANTTLYAQWASTTHTVVFNNNGGSGTMSNQTACASTALTSNAFTNGTCTFTGWNTAADGSGTSYANTASYSFTADITLYAQWSCSHTVTFNTNGGTGGSMSNQTASTTTNLTSNAFTKTGCTFAGWNTAANGLGTSYADGASYSFAADLTLYAQWNCGVSHAVTFNNNGGSGSMANQIASSATNLTSNAFTNGSCTFVSWNTVANGSGTSYVNGASYSFAADITLYAQWNCTPVCPTVKGALIDACQGTCLESQGEAVFLNSGSYSINVTTVAQATANINLWYGSSSSLTQSADHFTNAYVNNASAVSCLNSSTGCSGTFIDALGTTIPPFSEIMVVRSNFCCSATPDNNFAGLCGNGNIYVLFSSDANWNASGNFKNNTSGCGMRYFQFNSASTSCTFTANYDACSLTGYMASNDGGSVVWGTSGGAPSSYFNSGCSISRTILPIELVDFYATKNANNNDIVWKVSEEINILSYTIEKSENGIDFIALAKTPVNSDNKEYSGVKTYSLTDEEPYNEITYYRLVTLGKNGTQYSKTISVDGKSSNWESLHYQQNQQLVIAFKNNVPKNSSVSLFDLSGKLLLEQDLRDSQSIINTQNYDEGLYFVKIQSPYKTENFKIVIQK